jgi:TolB-like protein/DNA-binding winged helix-turn-helix (wHTH) protein/tetratricopeptide (TPR) repeat protein
MAICESVCYEFFQFRLDVEKQQLLKNGQPVQLTHKAFQILLLLVQNSGQTTKKEDIFNALWSDSFVEEGNLTQYIYVLRKVLGKTPEGQSYIETVPRQGYRFTLSPEQISVVKTAFAEESGEEAGEEAKETNALGGTERFEKTEKANGFELITERENEDHRAEAESIEEFPFSPEKPAAKKRPFFSGTMLAVLALLCLLGLIGATVAIYYIQPQPSQTNNAAAIRSIAVLPFKPIGEKGDKEKLGLGMADAIITQLSKLQQIEVRPTSAVFRYIDYPSINPLKTGKELGVDAVLEGTVQWDGDRVRVSVQLIQVSNEKSLWTETFHENISDIFAFQDTISRKVVSALSLHLTPQQERNLSAPGTTDHSAFQAYQMGIYFWNKRRKEDLFKAVDYFQQAIENDPNYAEAYAGLADSYSMLGFYGFADVSEMSEKSREAAEKALSLNESLGAAYLALGNTEIINNNFSKAKELLERAIVLSPYNASTHQRYGFVLLALKRLDEAVQEMRLAQRYDPLSPAINKALCNVLISKRSFSEAIEYCERASGLSPETPGNRLSLAHAYFHGGRYEDAVSQVNTEIKSGGMVNAAHSSLAYFYVKSGRLAEAKKIYEHLKQELKNDASLNIDLAVIAFALGKKDEAYEYFKKAVEINDSNPSMRVALAFDPSLDEIRADPRFAALMPE